MDKRYQKTVYACFVGYIVQAIVNNFVPLLFLTFHSTYGIPLTRITFLVTVNFCIQLVVDLLSLNIIKKKHRSGQVCAFSRSTRTISLPSVRSMCAISP